MGFERSRNLFERAKRVIPGGVNSPVRAFGAVEGTPPFIVRGKGSYLFDVDNNRYIDYVCSWGPLILGHCHPRVMRKIRDALAEGTSFGAPTEREVIMADWITSHVPHVDMVRMVNSGTEATMSSIRLARAVTGRDMIVKAEGNYHGHGDSLLVSAGSGAATFGIPDSPGVPASLAEKTVVVPYNDLNAIAEIFETYPDKIAAVIMEPVSGNMGVVLPENGYLEGIREITSKNGALFICDEVMTGFRLSLSGAVGLFALKPDIITFGKIIGGGLPVGAYGGLRKYMERIAPSGNVYQAGTLSGNPIALSAGLETLMILEEENPYPELERLTNLLAEGLIESAKVSGIPFTCNHIGSMITAFFTPDHVTNFSSAKKSDTMLFTKFHKGMLERGIYIPPSRYESWFLSTAHKESQIEKTIRSARQVFSII